MLSAFRQPAAIGATASKPWAVSYFLLSVLFLLVLHGILTTAFPLTEAEVLFWTKPRWDRLLLGNDFGSLRRQALFQFAVGIWLWSFFFQRPWLMLLALGTPVFLLGTVLHTEAFLGCLFSLVYIHWLLHAAKRFSRWGSDPVSRVYQSRPLSLLAWAVGAVPLSLACLPAPSLLALPVIFALWLARQYRLRSWIWGIGLQLAFPLFLVFAHGFPARWGSFSMGALAQTFLEATFTVGFLPFLALPWIFFSKPFLQDGPEFGISRFLCLMLGVLSILEAALGVTPVLRYAYYLSFFPFLEKLLARSSFPLETRGLLFSSLVLPWVVSVLTLLHLFPRVHLVPALFRPLDRWRAQQSLSEKTAQKVAVHAPQMAFIPTQSLAGAYYQVARQWKQGDAHSRYRIGECNSQPLKSLSHVEEFRDPRSRFAYCLGALP